MSKIKTIKELDRNKQAKQLVRQQNHQRRRNYVLKTKEIEDIEKIIAARKAMMADFLSQVESKSITTKRKDGNQMTKEDMESDILSMQQTIRDFEIKLLFAKEDLFNITEGIGIKIETMEAEVKKNYEEVNSFYDKNFKKD